MNYLLDNKRKKNSRIYKIILVIVVLFVFFIFRNGISRGLSYASHSIFRPVLILGNGIGQKFSDLSSGLSSKKALLQENEILKSQLDESGAKMANYNSIVDENNKIKEILGRKSGAVNMVLATILSKPKESIYGTFIIDAGINQGIGVGQRVFAFGNVPIGHIIETYADSSKVILYSNPGEKIEAIVSLVPGSGSEAYTSEDYHSRKYVGRDAYMEAVGRGGGNFEMVLPRDFVLEKGVEVTLPGTYPYVLATVSTIISDPRDSFQKALLASPVNIQELKFVEVEK